MRVLLPLKVLPIYLVLKRVTVQGQRTNNDDSSSGTSTAATTSNTQAETDPDENPFLEGRRFTSIAELLTNRLQFIDPTGNWRYKDVLKQIQQYGCYCFLDDALGGTSRNLIGNKGLPVDSMDKLCLDLFRCHRCIYDFDHPTEQCTIESKYKVISNAVSGEISCLNTNSPCQMAQCECDRNFSLKMATLWTNTDPKRKADFVYEKYYWKNIQYGKNNPTFNRKNTCKANGPVGNNADACCGMAGLKKPYSTANYKCCDDKISAFGTC